MFFDFYWFVLVLPFTSTMSPCKCNGQQCNQFFNSNFIRDMRVLKVKSTPLKTTEKALSGKELARYLFRTRFQCLPLRTARDVFHQAAHPVVFFKRVMCPVELAATFMFLYLARVMGGFSSPNITRVHRRGIHYSISATQHSSFFCAYVA